MVVILILWVRVPLTQIKLFSLVAVNGVFVQMCQWVEYEHTVYCKTYNLRKTCEFKLFMLMITSSCVEIS